MVHGYGSVRKSEVGCCLTTLKKKLANVFKMLVSCHSSFEFVIIILVIIVSNVTMIVMVAIVVIVYHHFP